MNVPFADGTEPCTQVDPESFFIEQPRLRGPLPHEMRLAIAICQTCHHLAECREWGIKHESHGIWGGLTPTDRQRMRKARGLVIQHPSYYHLLPLEAHRKAS